MNDLRFFEVENKGLTAIFTLEVFTSEPLKITCVCAKNNALRVKNLYKEQCMVELAGRLAFRKNKFMVLVEKLSISKKVYEGLQLPISSLDDDEVVFPDKEIDW